MGLFAKGKYGKLEYRLSYNKPFATNLVPTNVTTADNAVAVDNSGNTKWSKAGYFEYQFLDQKLITPCGYLGTKSVQYWCWFYTAPQPNLR
jgi:hypothetical protein